MPVTNVPYTSDPLLERLKAGEEAALAELFALHRERLWRMVCFRMDQRLLGRVDPDDVLQEAYLSAATRIEHFRDDSPASGFLWLRLIVSQTLVDIHRQHVGAKKRDAGREVPIRPAGTAPSTSNSMAARLAASITSPSQAAIRQERSRRLEEALQQMDEIDREVLALRHYEELTNSEVAEVLEIKQKAASIRYIRALKRFKVILAQFPEFVEGESSDQQLM